VWITRENSERSEKSHESLRFAQDDKRTRSIRVLNL
jgi:hypothetical protein